MIDYLIANHWAVWLVAALVLLILELSSGDFFLTCFSIGALGACATSLTGVPFWTQVLAFALCSVFSIWLVRPKLLHRLHASGENRPSNAEALIGREGVVVETIPQDQTGYVRVDGDEWRARTDGGTAINVGERVRVLRMESIVITVEKI